MNTNSNVCTNVSMIQGLETLAIINMFEHETVGKQAINCPSHLAMLTAANRIRTKKRGRSKMKGNYKKSSPQSKTRRGPTLICMAQW